MTIFLTLEEILLIHDRAINEFGGTIGIRDIGLVQSAIARPKAGFGDFEAYPGIHIKAAVLMHSLLKNHPFIDGNKRTATIAMITFLLENNIKLNHEKDEIYNLAMKVEDNSFLEEDIAKWLKNHSRS
jgi:death-on-curing protein